MATYDRTKMEGFAVFELHPEDAAYDPVGKIEVWDFIVDQDLPYLLGNVVKYVSRAGKKDPNKQLEDLHKAEAYLRKEIERVEAQVLENNKEKN